MCEIDWLRVIIGGFIGFNLGILVAVLLAEHQRVLTRLDDQREGK